MNTKMFPLLQSCSDEYRTQLIPRISKEIQELTEARVKSMMQTTLKLCILDIGAGNGKLFLEAAKDLQSKCDIDELEKITIAYVAYECEDELFSELRDMTLPELRKLSIIQDASAVCDVFTETSTISTLSHFDLILFSHTLYGYGSKNRQNLVRHAVEELLDHQQFGSRLILVHRKSLSGNNIWEDLIQQFSTNEKFVAHREEYEAFVDFRSLNEEELQSLCDYIKVNIDDTKASGNICYQKVIFMRLISNSSKANNKSSTFGKKSSRHVNFHCRGLFTDFVFESICPLSNLSSRIHTSLFSQNQKLRFVPESRKELCSLMDIICDQHLKFSVIGGGHSHYCVHQNASISIDMSAFDQVKLHELDSNVLRIGGGCTSQHIINVAKHHSLLMPLGDRPGVGIGLALQGGIGLFTRQVGLTCDNIEGVTFYSLRKRKIVEISTLSLDGLDSEMLPVLWGFRGAGNRFGPILEICLRGRPAFTGLHLRQHALMVSKNEETKFENAIQKYEDRSMNLPHTSSEECCLLWKNRKELCLGIGRVDVQFSSSELSSDSQKQLPTPSKSLNDTSSPNILKSSSPDRNLDRFPSQIKAEDFKTEEENHKLLQDISLKYQDDLFDKELFSNPNLFAPNRFNNLEPYTKNPVADSTSGHLNKKIKLRSHKRCVFLPELPADLLCRALIELDTRSTNQLMKNCYIHILPGNDKTSSNSGFFPEFGSVFRGRGWKFAAVITALFEEGCEAHHEDNKNLCIRWVEDWTRKLVHAVPGSTLYVTDLGPDDSIDLVRPAYLAYVTSESNNRQNERILKNLHLLTLEHDPYSQIVSACRISSLVSSQKFSLKDFRQIHAKTIYVIVCGRRCSGKDYVAEFVTKHLNERISDGFAEVRRISDCMKKRYASENPGVDVEKLINNRVYRNQHRSKLQKYYAVCKEHDEFYGERSLLDMMTEEYCGSTTNPQLVFITGLRDGLPFCKKLRQEIELYRKNLFLLKIQANDETKRRRGWEYNPVLDEDEYEIACDNGSIEWDCILDTSNPAVQLSQYDENGKYYPDGPLLTQFHMNLIPKILNKCVLDVEKGFSFGSRKEICNDGKITMDLVDPFSLLRNPLSARLTIENLVWKLKQNIIMVQKSYNRHQKLDLAIVAPEAGGYPFAALLSSSLNVNWYPIRKRKMPSVPAIAGPCLTLTTSNCSWIEQLATDRDNAAPTTLEVQVFPEENVIIVDDVVSTGNTVKNVCELITRNSKKYVMGVVCGIAFVENFGDYIRNIKCPLISSIERKGK